MKKIITLVFSLMFLSVITYGQQFTWKQKGDFAGIYRLAAFSFTLGSHAYLGGGFVNLSNFTDFWQYSPVTDSWTQLSNIPMAVRAAGSFTANGYGYVTNGILQSGTMTNALYQYDTLNNVWTIKSPFPGTARYGGVSFSLNGKGYYGIGNSGTATGPYLNDFYMYDPATDSWTARASFIGVSRYGAFSISDDTVGFAGFGVNESSNSWFNDWYKYDPVNNIWSVKTSCPGAGRSYPSGFLLQNNILVGTGKSNNILINDFYTYNISNNSWIQLGNFPGGIRWVASGFAIDSSGYIAAGYDSINYHKDVWEYSAQTETALNTIHRDFDMIITPCPFTDHLTVNVNSKKGNNICSYIIYNLNGSKVLSGSVSENEQLTEGISALKNGVYLFSLSDGSTISSKKIIKL